jgi:hypothetical protein
MRQTRVEFDASSARDYEFTHGHRPRGTGNWCFGLGRGGAWTQFWFNGSYTDGKRAAVREARGLGCDTVVVNT